MKQTKIIFLICTLFISVLQAQVSCEELALPQERVTVHLDRNICLAGETIWFKAWCFLDGQVEVEMSKVIYVEVFDENQKVIVQEKYLLENNKAIGSILIPEDVASKHYFLKAYTRYMRNFSSDYFHYQGLTIVNPYIEEGSIEVKDTEVAQEQGENPTPTYVSDGLEKTLQIELQKEQYQPRERINFQIKSLQPISAELSATVRLQGLGNQPNQKVLLQNDWLLASCNEDPFCRQAIAEENTSANVNDWKQQEILSSLNANQLQWLPETRGLTISGLVQNKKGKKMAEASTMLAVLQKSPLFYMVKTDSNGAFTFSLQNMAALQNLFVGTPDEKNTVLIRNDFDADFPAIANIPLQFDSSLHQLLERLHLHQQLERTYPKNKTEKVLQSTSVNATSRNILGPDRRIVLADFIKMTTMSEVFGEILPGVQLRKKGKNARLTIFNSEQQKLYEEPLVLLDNVPVFDIPELLKVDPAKIESIEVYNTDYILGDDIIGGIISINSNTDNFAAFQWSDQGVFTKFKSYATVTSFEKVIHREESHLPDFRPVLYWYPSLQLVQQKSSESIVVYAPDQPGVYEILVQGYTDAGEACMGYITFEVLRGISK